MGVKFINFKTYDLEIRWDDKTALGTFSGAIAGGARTSTLTYSGHAFFFVDARAKERREVARFQMLPDVNLYIIQPDERDAATLASQERRSPFSRAFSSKIPKFFFFGGVVHKVEFRNFRKRYYPR